MKNIICAICVLFTVSIISCTKITSVDPVISPQNKLGVNFDRKYFGDFYQNGSLPNIITRIDSLANHGVEMITIYKAYYTDGVNSFYLHEEFPSDNPGWSNYSYNELAQMVAYAKNRGMIVQYAIEICPIGRGGNGWHNGYGEIWRGHFNPSNTAYFFHNFWNKVKIDAQFCELQGVEIINIGQENVLLTTPDKDAYWHALIDSIKTQYSGSISYYFNGGQYNRISQQFQCCEFAQVSSSFYSNFDILGITMYPSLSDEAVPSLNSLKTGLAPIFNYCEQIHNQTGKPFIIGETSCPSVEYPLTQNYVSWAWDVNALMTKATNYQGQANYAKALTELAVNKNWLLGIFWHNSYYNPDNQNNAILLEKGPSPFNADLRTKLIFQ